MGGRSAEVDAAEVPRPVAVVPVKAETTSCIAACYMAKKLGVRTGTPVWEARKLCPGIVFCVADHKKYVITHNRVVAAVVNCCLKLSND